MKRFFMIFLTVMYSVLLIAQDTLYVTSTGVGDGSSWANATADLQQAIDDVALAGGGDVWVAAGTYTPFNSFQLKEGVEIYGGFFGTETDTSQRDIESNITILHGNASGSDVVRNATALTAASRLDGFTLTTDMSANGVYLNSNYGTTECIIDRCKFAGFTVYAIDIDASGNDCSPIIQNCTFSGNSANTISVYVYDAAINSDLQILSNTFSDNTDNNGAAIELNIQAGTFDGAISDNDFISNTTVNDGGAVYIQCYDTMRGEVSGNLFTNNESGNGGGALYLRFDGSEITTILDNNIFSGNEARKAGALQFQLISGSFTPTFSNNQIISNIANDGAGGAIIMSSTGAMGGSFIDNTIKLNSATEEGGAISVRNYSGKMTTLFSGNAFAHNTAVEGSGAMDLKADGDTLAPSIVGNTFYNNSGERGGAVYSVTQTAVTQLSFVNNLVYNNYATEECGGVFIRDYSAYTCEINAKLINNTIVNNFPEGLQLYLHGDGTHTTTASNTILWGNQSTTVGGQVHTSGVGFIFKNCLVQDGERAMFVDAEDDHLKDLIPFPDHSITCDPSFVLPVSFCGNAKSVADTLELENADWSLLNSSPCINLADADSIPGEYPTDIDGNARTIYGEPDIGAYEFNGSLPAIPAILSQPEDLTSIAGYDTTLTVTATNTAGYRWQIYTDGAWEYIRDTIPFYHTGLSVLEITDIGMEYDNSSLRCEVFNASGSVYSNTVTISLSLYDHDTILVTEDGAGERNGSSWGNSFSGDKIQTAIYMLDKKGGGQIWVADGTYLPTHIYALYAPYSSIHKLYEVRDNIKLYGGFNGTETTLDERDFTTNISTLSGDVGVADDTADNCVTIVAGLGNISSATCIDGFRLIDTYVTDDPTSPDGQGGAITVWSYTGSNYMEVRNNTIENNFFNGIGGGIALFGYFYENAPTLESNIMRNNTGDCGGILAYSEMGNIDVTIVNNVIHNNEGSGIFFYSANEVINGNIVNNTIANNGAAGIVVYENPSASTATLTNNIIWNSPSSIENYGGELNIGYSIIDESAINNSGGVINYTGGTFASTCLSSDPKFNNPSEVVGMDATQPLCWNILEGSPALNSGINDSIPVGISTDFLGNARIATGVTGGTATVDMGAYEFAAETSTFNAVVNNDWHNSLNWDAGVPTTNMHAIVSPDTYVEINGPAYCNKLTLGEGSSLTANDLLSVADTMWMKAGGSTDVTASVIQNSTMDARGVVLADQYLTANRWWYMSSPLENATAAAFAPENSVDNYTYYWDETDTATHGWNAITSNDFSLNPLQGYAVRYQSADTTIQFEGEIGEMSYVQDLTRTEGVSKDGYNLVGNPFLSAVNWDLFAGKTNISNSYWVRSNGVFISYNSKAGVGTFKSTPVIPAMQAFWVKVDNAYTTGQITVDNTAQVHGSAVLDKDETPNPVIRLQLANQDGFDEMVLTSIKDADDGFEEYDTRKMLEESSNIPQVYSLCENNKLSINSIGEVQEQVIPVGCIIKEFGKHTFTLESNTFESDVYLEDRITGEFVELSKTTTYSFDASAGDVDNRFVIHLHKSATGVEPDEFSGIQVFAYGKTIVVNFPGETGTVSVTSMKGNTIIEKSLVSSTNKLQTNLEAGIYLVKVKTNSETKVAKVVLK